MPTAKARRQRDRQRAKRAVANAGLYAAIRQINDVTRAHGERIVRKFYERLARSAVASTLRASAIIEDDVAALFSPFQVTSMEGGE